MTNIEAHAEFKSDEISYNLGVIDSYNIEYAIETHLIKVRSIAIPADTMQELLNLSHDVAKSIEFTLAVSFASGEEESYNFPHALLRGVKLSHEAVETSFEAYTPE